MHRIATVEVSKEELESMYVKYEIWEKINNGELTIYPLNPVTSTSYLNCTSQMLLHFTLTGKHIATTHRIREKNGRVVHWDAHDIRIEGVCYWRA
jgi:hypothetical protein